MDGLMQNRPLVLKTIAERAETLFGDREVAARTNEGVERTTYREITRRARRLASALQRAGVRPGDRVATFAWNCARHLELYLAVPAMGAVLHTLNVRLAAGDLRYIVEDAGDRVIFIDASLADALPRVKGVDLEVVMSGPPDVRAGALAYEQLILDGDPAFAFPDVAEDTAAAMCYTSGTTGRPKGVVYSHRSTVLHTLVAAQVDVLRIGEHDSVMPVVPMFHANAWGIPYTAAMCGARLVLPGPRPTASDIARLITEERVTKTAGVPTVWQDVAQLSPKPDLSVLEEIVCGGSAASESLIATYRERFGVPIVQAWGMTETSPLGAISRPAPGTPPDGEVRMRALQGTPIPLIEARVDSSVGGELQVSGPWVAATYYGEAPGEKFTADGWLRTGDVVELVDDRYLRLVDRTKDLIKSGGEWISSVELENHISAHPDVIEAAVIAVPDERWGERPCACVVPRDGADLGADDLRAFLTGRVASWWIPERVLRIDAVPRTSVGKYDKKALRARYAETGDWRAL